MPNILLLSENNLFCEDLKTQLSENLPEGYKIYCEDDSETVFDIALLDGKKFLEAFRQNHTKVPALILEPSDSEEYTENTLDMFIYKPIVLSGLFNQIQSGINVFENSTEGFLRFGEYELHPADKEILNLKTGDIEKLTEREVSIIQYLYKSKNKIVGKTELLENVWEYNADVSTHTIETHIYRLRKKVEKTQENAPLIYAEDGGYRLVF